MVETPTVEQPPKPKHHAALVGGLAVFTLTIAGLSSGDSMALLVALTVGLLCIYYECWVLEGPSLVRIGVAIVATIVLAVFARKVIFDPVPLSATPSTDRQLAQASSEQDVREVLEDQARAYRSLTALLDKPTVQAPRSAPAPDPSVEKKRLESNLALWEFYPKYEWPLSGDATANSRSIEGQTLRARFMSPDGEYRLTPLLFNGNAGDGVPLLNPNIDVFFPVTVQASETRLWAPNINETHRVFSTGPDFGPVLTAPSGVNESLFLKFPRPGRYQVRFRLSGIAKDLALRKDGEFTLELVGPTP